MTCAYDPLNPTWPPESAVIVPVVLPRKLERLRVACVPVASIGVPAHVTLLYPFIPPAEIGPPDVAVLRQVLAAEPPFDVEVAEVRTFPAEQDRPGTTYLEPLPAEPFVRLTRAIWAAFPTYPPFEGAYAEIIPHLTVADAASRLPEAEAIAASALPMRWRVNEAWLMVEGEDRRWRRRARLPLGVGGSGRPPGNGPAKPSREVARR